MRAGVGVAVLAILTVVAWWLWLGHDTEYQIDPATGMSSGPYEAWQVGGCVLSVAVLAIVGGLFLRPWAVVATMTIVFTGSWSSTAATADESGLWLVGAVLVFVGMASGSALLSFGASLVRKRLSASAGPGTSPSRTRPA
jgi:hypothetical protein